VHIAKAIGNEFFNAQAYFFAATLYIDKQPFQAISNYEKALKIFSNNAINKGADHLDNCRKIIKYNRRCSAPKSTMQGF